MSNRPRTPVLHRTIGISMAVIVGASICFASSAATLIRDVRLSATADTTRVVLDLSAPTTANMFTLENPDRLVVDLADTQLQLGSDRLPEGRGQVKELRTGERAAGELRLVFDLAGPVAARSFTVDPDREAQLGHRLVVDLKAAERGQSGNSNIAAADAVPVLKIVKSIETATQGRDIVIAVDAGHGGEDPGAIGHRGTREKDVTLAIARKLKARIDAEPGMRAVLTRDSDTFVPLRERIVRASKQHADLFVSVHADSVRDRHVKGSSVYVLSAGRASNEAARMLADRENAADLIGGVPLDDKDDVLASVLLDLSQGASMSASVEAAEKVLSQLGRFNDVLDSDVKSASLKVLTSPNIPSMLIETAFISNPNEETKLRDTNYQQRLADAVLTGVRSYFYQNPLPGTTIAQLKAQQRKLAQGEKGGAGLGSSVLAVGSVSP